MSSSLIFVGLPEDSKSSITKVPLDEEESENKRLPTQTSSPGEDENKRVPNAPKSSIGEIFKCEVADGGRAARPARPRGLRDTPTRPRDTHSRLFGQAAPSPVSPPMVTDTHRSHIQFGEGGAALANGALSPTKLVNGSAPSTPGRGEPVNGIADAGDH